MRAVSTTAETWMVAGVVARAFTHDGRPIGRALAWPMQYLIALNTAAFAARDVVWDRTSSGSIATAVVPCRSARPRQSAGGAIVSVLGLDAFLALAVVGAMVTASLVGAWLFVLVVAALLAPLAAVMGPMVTGRSRAGERVLRQWRRALQAQGHTVVTATYVAAWPLGGGAGGQLSRPGIGGGSHPTGG